MERNDGMTAVDISIHAARVGCDEDVTKFTAVKNISIHAARVGCDSELEVYEISDKISIHAARVGCDSRLFRMQRRYNNFNPRSPSGLRLHFQNNLCRRQNDFNPRSPSGLRRTAQ